MVCSFKYNRFKLFVTLNWYNDIYDSKLIIKNNSHSALKNIWSFDYFDDFFLLFENGG